jgi:hypothetical protein
MLLTFFCITISWSICFKKISDEYYMHNGEAKRWHEPAGSGASKAGGMPSGFSELLAPRKYERGQLKSLSRKNNTGGTYQSASKELTRASAIR